MQYWDYKMDEERINFINEGRTTIYAPCSQFYFNDPYGELPLVRTYDRGIHLTNLSRKAYKIYNASRYNNQSLQTKLNALKVSEILQIIKEN
jgi:hypothetical protein